MNVLKIKVSKEKWEDVIKLNTFSIELTPSIVKQILKSSDNVTEEDLNGVYIDFMQELSVTRMFSSDNIVFKMKYLHIKDGIVTFFYENEPKNTSGSKNTEPVEKTEESISKRVEKLIDEFSKNSKVYVVGTPRVAIHPNGVVFGIGRKLPIENDVRFYIDIEKQILYHTYDMSDDEFINNLQDFFKRMLVNNFVFMWKNKCEYKESNGKRYVVLYYTTRRFINQNKR
jgi:hypothetical protein